MLTYSGALYDERTEGHTDTCVYTPTRLHKPALISESAQRKVTKHVQSAHTCPGKAQNMLTYSGALYDERTDGHTDTCVYTPTRLHKPALISKSAQRKVMNQVRSAHTCPGKAKDMLTYSGALYDERTEGHTVT